jgi:hypothetical protein
MPRKAGSGFRDKDLSKGQLRKLTALRKSLGDEIANRAFMEWLSQQPGEDSATDGNAAKIADALTKLVKAGELKFPRGGYILRRGRGRVIVERPE